MHLFMLSKDNLSLARAEALAVCRPKTYHIEDDILLFKTRKDFTRLAYTHIAIKVLMVTDDLSKTGSVSWKKEISGSYSVRKDGKADIQMLSGIIWRSLNAPVVNLKDPGTEIMIIKRSKYHIGKLVWKNPKGFDRRKAHKRPVLYPSSLHPKLARACVNLLGTKDVILDPFCGTGGILIEAGLMGHKIAGYDIDEKMINAAKKNLAHFGLSARIICKSATAYDRKYKNIVTDLPYGRNTKDIDNDLYAQFLRRFTGKAVIIFPGTAPYKKLIKKAGLKIKAEFSERIHKSLQKHIVMLEIHSKSSQ